MKLIFSLMCCICVLFGDILDDKIQNLIGIQAFNINKNFITRIFRDKQSFYTDGQINIKKLIVTLKDNGLLMLKFDKPSQLNITFVSKITPILLIRTVSNTLSSMGYSYFAVCKAQYAQEISKITFTFLAERALDPSVIIDELTQNGYVFENITRTSLSDWEYDIRLIKSHLSNTLKIAPSEELLDVREVSGEYWFDIQDKGNMTIISKTPYWYPKIVFYDDNLRIIDLMTQNTNTNKISFNLSDQIRFIMVSDMKNPDTIRSGLHIKFSAISN